MSFFEELKRRNVLRVAAAYVVTAWLLIQVAETILPQYGLEHHVRTVITVLAIGFLPAVILAWALEWTPTGIRWDLGPAEETADDSAAAVRSARKFDRIVIVILTLALAWFVYDKLAPTAPEARYSIAVLPFANESPDQLPDYLAAGLAGEVLDLLAKLPELLVIARSSAFSFVDEGVSLAEIGKRLGVSHILEGALAQVGGRVQVSARLVDAVSGSLVWTQTYAGSLAEIIAIHSKIATDVVARLEMQDASSLPQTRQTSQQAFALTLQARELWYAKLTEDFGLEMAALLEEALQSDPQYTPALVWMIYANWQLKQQGVISAEEEKRRWLTLAARILALEPDNANVHDLFGWEALYVNRDVNAAAASFQRAIHSAPNDVEILRHVARFLFAIGRKDDGLAIIDRAMAVDPLCSYCLYGASRLYMYAGELDRAESLRRRFLALHGQGKYEFGIIRLLQGEADDALTIYKELEVSMSQPGVDNDGRAHAGQAMALYDLGRLEESDAQVQILTERFGEEYPEPVAQALAWRDDKDEAFVWLARARDVVRSGRSVAMLADPVYRKLHDDPRWSALRDESGFGDARLAGLNFTLPAQLRPRKH